MYLESNAIDTIENLDHMVEMRCLYLGKNMIHSISGLGAFALLETLDLSGNDLYRLENLSGAYEVCGRAATMDTPHVKSRRPCPQPCMPKGAKK